MPSAGTEISRDRVGSVSLYGENLVVIDGALCGLNMRPKKYDGYQAVGVIGNIAIIKDGEEKLGYYDVANEELIAEPKFAYASPFSGGYAAVRYTVGGETAVIDMQGKEVARFERNAYGFYDGYMFIDDEFGGLALYDSDFSDTGLRFDNVVSRRVFGDYVLDGLKGRFFSVSEKEYVGDAYDSVVPVDCGFICKNKTALLLGKDLKKLAEFDDITSDGDILCVKQNGKFYYFYPSAKKAKF